MLLPDCVALTSLMLDATISAPRDGPACYASPLQDTSFRKPSVHSGAEAYGSDDDTLANVCTLH